MPWGLGLNADAERWVGRAVPSAPQGLAPHNRLPGEKDVTL